MVEPMLTDKGDPMEPELHFHEFLFLLGLISKNCITQSKDDTIQSKLVEFFIDKLNLKKVSQMKDVDLNYEDVLNHVYSQEEAEERYDKVDGSSMESDEWGESQSSEEESGVTNK